MISIKPCNKLKPKNFRRPFLPFQPNNTEQKQQVSCPHGFTLQPSPSPPPLSPSPPASPGSNSNTSTSLFPSTASVQERIFYLSLSFPGAACIPICTTSHIHAPNFCPALVSPLSSQLRTLSHSVSLSLTSLQQRPALYQPLMLSSKTQCIWNTPG